MRRACCRSEIKLTHLQCCLDSSGATIAEYAPCSYPRLLRSGQVNLRTPPGGTHRIAADPSRPALLAAGMAGAKPGAVAPHRGTAARTGRLDHGWAHGRNDSTASARGGHGHLLRLSDLGLSSPRRVAG